MACRFLGPFHTHANNSRDSVKASEIGSRSWRPTGHWAFDEDKRFQGRQQLFLPVASFTADQTSRWSWSHSQPSWFSRSYFSGWTTVTLCASWLAVMCHTEPLQNVVNAAARLVLNLRPRDHVTPALHQLHWLPIDYRITYKLCLIMHLVRTKRAPQYLYDSVQRQSRVPAVDLVSDLLTQLSASSRGAEPSSESAASLMLDLLHGTVFHTISIKSVTLVFSNTASKLNCFAEHTSLVLVSASGRSVNSAIEMTILLHTFREVECIRHHWNCWNCTRALLEQLCLTSSINISLVLLVDCMCYRANNHRSNHNTKSNYNTRSNNNINRK